MTKANDSHASEMDRYIDIDNYNRYEEGHPGYQEMMQGVVGSTIKACVAGVGKLSPNNRGRVLEIGAGTGNYTRRIGAQNNIDVVANEIDASCNRYLTHKIENGEIQNTTLVPQDFMTLHDEGHTYHAINTTFADHHFSPADKPKFLKSIHSMLAEKGEYILGDEFLPPHDETNPAERVSAQLAYHGMIIENAYKEGKIELPALERDALISGLRTTTRFIQQTVPSKATESFAVAEGAPNSYNAEGAQMLHTLIERLSAIDATSLLNPEAIDAASLPQKRTAFIESLRTLEKEMKASRQPGLGEDPAAGIVGGDYKMTIRQYSQCLNAAGFNATGYFQGPQPVGTITETLDQGTLGHPVALTPNQEHAGGIWVIRAQQRSHQTAEIAP